MSNQPPSAFPYDAIKADAKWQLVGHKEVMDDISKLLPLPDAASRIATLILAREDDRKKEWAELGPCGRHPLVVYALGAGLDGADSYRGFTGYGFPMTSPALTDAGLVRICQMCKEELDAKRATKQ